MHSRFDSAEQQGHRWSPSVFLEEHPAKPGKQNRQVPLPLLQQDGRILSAESAALCQCEKRMPCRCGRFFAAVEAGGGWARKKERKKRPPPIYVIRQEPVFATTTLFRRR